MKKLLLIAAVLFLIYQAAAQTIQIRWYDINKPGTRHTVKFDAAGTPSNAYRLAYASNDGYLIGSSLHDQLMAGNVSEWNSLPFCINVPIYDPPARYVRMEVEPEPPDTIAFEWVQNMYYTLYMQAYAFQKQVFEDLVQNSFVVMRGYIMPKIPDGPNIRWESVNPDKPYRYRYEPMDVVPGLYSGQTIWKVIQADAKLYQRFADNIQLRAKKNECAGWIAFGRLFQND